MTPSSTPFPVIILLALLKCVQTQSPVQISFTTNPVLATSGQPAEFSIVTSEIFSTQWVAPGGGAIGTWTSAGPAINSNYQNRVTLTATQLRFNSAEMRDAGNYSATVAPTDSTGLTPSTASVEMKVFVAVADVSLSVVPSVAVEGRNVTLRCTWSAGTQTSVAWGKGDTALNSGDRITISGGTLSINPARRDDTGDYSCTVSNPVSVQTTRTSLTIYYGPDTPTLTKDSADCVGGGDGVVGQAFQITCASQSLPPATFTWQHDGEAVSSSQSNTGMLSLQLSSTDSSGRYVCVAQNSITGGSSQQETEVSVVSTCLSGGAVAGIVIACFLVIVIIIAIIIVLLRQRNMDRRLRDAVSLQKTSQDPVARPPPANIRADTAPDPLLHNPNTHRPPDNQPNGTNTLQQNGLHNSNTNNAVQQNGHLGNGTLHRHGNSVTNGNLNGIGNGYSGQQNNGSFPNPGQQNPNVVIQTGQTQSGPSQPTVHVNLNTLPMADHHNGNTQPQTVNVNLNTFPPPSPGRQEVNTISGPEAHTLAHNNMSTLARYDRNHHRDSLIQTDHSHVNPAFESDVLETRQPPPYGHATPRSDRHVRNDFGQGHQSRPADGHHSASRRQSTDHDLRQSHHGHTRSRTRDNDYPTDDHNLRHSNHGQTRDRSRTRDNDYPTDDHNLRQSNHGQTRDRSRTRDNDYPNDDHDLRHSNHDQTRDRSRTRSSDDRRHTPDPMETPARHQQRPWDTLRGTPAYPNQQTPPAGWSSSSSSGSSTGHQQSSGHQQRPSQTAPPSGNTAQTQRQTTREDRVRERDRDQDRRRNRDGQRADDRRENDPVFLDPNIQIRRGQLDLSSRQAEQNPTQRHAMPQNPNPATHANTRHTANTAPRSTATHMPTAPQNPNPGTHANANHTAPRPTSAAVQPHSTPQQQQPPPYGAQVRQADRWPEQRQTTQQVTSVQPPVQTGRNQNQPSPLTQATLQHHTRHTHNPFTDRNQQTQAALLHPGPQARQQQPRTQTAQTAQPRTQPSAQPPPATQRTKDTGRRPPTPPPVLHPHQFQALPRERTQQQQQQQPHVRPAAVPMRHEPVPVPVHLPPGHRPPGATHKTPRHGAVPAHHHRHPAHAHANTHRHVPTDAHLHANLQRHTIAHRPPPEHLRQAHKSKPR